MKASTSSVWKYLPIRVRLSIILSNSLSNKGFLFMIFRTLSLFQVLLGISNNLKHSLFKYQTFFQPIFNVLQYEMNFLNFSISSKSCMVIFWISVFYFMLHIFIIIIALHSSYMKNLSESRSLKLFATIANFHAEVLYYPLNLTLFRLYVLWVGEQVSPEARVTLAIVIILLCANSLFAFSNISFCYCRIQSHKFINRKGSLHLLFIASLKFSLSFFQCLFIYDGNDTKIFEISSGIVSLVISLGILVYIMIVLPEYNLKILKVHVVFNSIAVAISIFQLFELIVDDKELIFILALLIVPFWVKLILNKFQSLIDFIKHFPDKISNVNYSVHLEVIYNELQDNFDVNLVNKRFPVAILEMARPTYYTLVESESIQTLNELEIESFHKNTKDYLRKSFEKLLKLKPNNILNSLTYAQFIIDNFCLYSKSYYLCAKASHQALKIPDLISIFYLKCKIQKTLQKEMEIKTSVSNSSRSLWQQIISEETYQDFQSHFCEYTECSMSFWQNLRADKPNILKLSRDAKTIEKQRLIIEYKWKNHQSQDYPLGYLLYGVFKATFMNMPYEGIKLIERYNFLIKNKLIVDNETNIDDQLSGTLMISGSKESLGKILSYSASIPKIFKRDTKSLMQENVNLLMPRFFQEKHNQFLLSHYETGASNLMGQERILYGKDGNNNIFPISLIIGMPPNLEKGIVFIALIKKLEDQNEYILFNQEGVIEEVSAEIEKILQIQPYKKLNIESLCTEFSFADLKNISVQNFSLKNTSLEDISSHPKKSAMLTFRQSINNVEKTFIFRTELTSFKYHNATLNVMILRLRGKFDRRVHAQERTIQAIQEESTHKNLEVENASANTRDVIEFLFKKKAQKKQENYQKNLKHLEYTRSKASSMSPATKHKMIDNFHKTLLMHPPDRFRKLFIIIFMFVIFISLSIAGIQYIVLKDSSQEMTFAINSIRTTYERLTSLIWVWWFCMAYTTRIEGITTTNDAELDRFKLLMKTNRQKMKIANDELLRIVGAGKKYQQDTFFANDIKFTYENTSTSFKERELNSFEAINIVVDKLVRFDTTPHKQIFQLGGNADLEFVRKNSMNDLLISSETLVAMVERFFSSKIKDNENLMSSIFYLGISFNFIAIFIVCTTFYSHFERDSKIIRAITTIDTANIDLVIKKFVCFQKLFKGETSYFSQELFRLYFEDPVHKTTLAHSKLLEKEHNIKGFFVVKLRQCLLLILLFVCFSLGYSVGHISWTVSLEELLKTNNRAITPYKARYRCNLALASLVGMVQSRNTTTMRNQRLDIQLLANIKAVYANEIMFETFTDQDGKFIHPSIESLFKGKPCSLVVDYPGSQNPTNCPKATHNETIGIFAVNSYYRDELYTLATEMMGDLTLSKSKKILPTVSGTTAPKVTTIVGGYMFLMDLMSQKFNEEMSDLLENGKLKLILELILMSFIAFLIMWILINKVLNDSSIRLILKLIPFDEISNNKLLRSMVERLYKGKIDVFKYNM